MTTTMPPLDRPLRARATRFDLSGTPLEWIPGNPHASLGINTLHLFLPPGERWFCDVYRDALEHIWDPELHAQVKGFIAQEATHAKAHDRGLEYLANHGVDLRAAVEVVDAVRTRFRALVRRLPRPLRLQILKTELATIAGIEHHTAVLGGWVLNAGSLDAAGADPVMLDLLRWHGAEEVEHRNVAFDAYQHIHGGHPRRALIGALVGAAIPAILVLAIALSYLSPDRSLRYRRGSHRLAVRMGLLPSLRSVMASVRDYLRRDYHPTHYGSLDQALEYLGQSPGVVRRRTAHAADGTD